MLNIELYLEDQLVELTDNVSFPLNKSFENLWNPTDIIVEYSKSINVPATANNNKLMANAYRLDRQYVINTDNLNIGMYLDPLKRIPMKLIYNGSILLDGYAKYTSATVNSKKTYYTFNLYGALGDVFQSLNDCVLDENKLTDEQKAEPDGGRKYIITAPWESYKINKEFVKKSWESDTVLIGSYNSPYAAIGMAPAYRGNYENFESNSVLGLNWYTILDGAFPKEATSVEDQLKSRWKTNLINNKDYTAEQAQARVDALDYDMIIPNGLNEHNMKQFRSYEQKPYIYFHALLDLYQRKCRELTGYELKLDNSWFNSNNPYYANLCYMFDYLSVKGNTLQASLPFTGYTTRKFTDKYCSASASYEITDSDVLSKDDITIDSFTLCLQVKDTPYSTIANPNNCIINMDSHSCIIVDVTVNTGGTTSHYYFWGGTGTPSTTANVGPSTGNNSKYPKDKYIYMTEKTQYNQDENKLVWNGYLTIPNFTISHTANESISITYKLQYLTNSSMANDRYKWKYSYVSTDGKTYTAGIPRMQGISVDEWNSVVDNEDYKFIIPNITYNSNWRTNMTCELKNLYSKDESLFNVILQYTKMMHLIWKADYNKKTITIMTLATYFKGYDIVDWTDKVDKSKDMVITPVSFATKYTTFNYENVDGYRYTGYKNKYGINYGEKKLRTKYNFDNSNTDMFKSKIYPSSVSCKSHTIINDLKNWDTISTLPVTASEINFIDCENNEATSAIALNNWYFRLPNKKTDSDYRIVDASSVELSQNKYFWLGNGVVDYYGVGVTVDYLPQFSPVIKSTVSELDYGCLFNCPNEDYTNDKTVQNGKGRYIYDVCWQGYINERYNANNKKVICYVNLLPSEFEEFNFKKFVTIDNQLFIVNKIMDYNVNKTLTKCELIQITDIEGYTKSSIEIEPYVYGADSIYITTKYNESGDYYTGSASFTIYGLPSITEVEDFELKIVPIKKTVDSGTCYFEGGDVMSYGYDMPIYYDADESGSEEYELQITAFGEVKKIPIYIN